MELKRVVITGMGAVTPIGNTVEEFWQGLKNGVNGIAPITLFDTAEHKIKLAAEVKDFDVDRYLDKKEQRRTDRFCHFGISAAAMAWEDSGLTAETIDPYDLAVIVGSGVGGLSTMEREHAKLLERGPSRVSPLMIPMMIGNILGGNIAIQYGAKNGCQCIVTACASGTNSIGEAFRLIRYGNAVAAFAGAAEATITPLAIAAFNNMTALSTRSDPDNASTPFDKNRDGFVMGEGAAVMILEEYGHAKARGARIHAELVGYGSTCDAYHITLPAPGGEGAAASMRLAMKDAGISPGDISYINAHGTSTPANDLFETMAVKTALGEQAYRIPVTSTKGNTGHMLGAAGAVELVACVKALQDSFVPPTLNLTEPDPELDLDYVPNEGRPQELCYAMSNSLGFGGHNGTLIVKKLEE